MQAKNYLTEMTTEEKRARADEKRAFLEKWLALTGGQVNSWFKNVPKTMQMLYLRVHKGESSMRERLKLKCLDCCNWERSEVAKCTIEHCALWAERPYQGK